MKLCVLVKELNAKLRGYYNYYGIYGNSKSLVKVFFEVTRVLFKWLNRRSQKKSFNWETFKYVMRYYKLLEPFTLNR